MAAYDRLVIVMPPADQRDPKELGKKFRKWSRATREIIIVFTATWMASMVSCSRQSEPAAVQSLGTQHILVASDHEQPDARVQIAAQRCAALVKPPSAIKKVIDWQHQDDVGNLPNLVGSNRNGLFVRVRLQDDRDAQCIVSDQGSIDLDPEVIDCASIPKPRPCY